MVLQSQTIDLSSDPFVPAGWTVIEHSNGGSFTWDPCKIALYRSLNQMGDRLMEGADLWQELKDKPVFNANLLDHLLENSRLIPEEWLAWVMRFGGLYFWGTIYRHSNHNLCVRSLAWGGDRCTWGGQWIDMLWGCTKAAVIAAK